MKTFRYLIFLLCLVTALSTVVFGGQETPFYSEDAVPGFTVTLHKPLVVVPETDTKVYYFHDATRNADCWIANSETYKWAVAITCLPAAGECK